MLVVLRNRSGQAPKISPVNFKRHVDCFVAKGLATPTVIVSKVFLTRILSNIYHTSRP